MKKIIWIFVIVLAGIQFIPANRPENSSEQSKDLIINNQIPDHIAGILKTSCYDCHSNQTQYPWYSYVAPVSFLIAHDVKEGRDELNFSLWENMKKSKKAKALNEISEEVEEAEMPLDIYLITHPKAKLSDKQRKELIEWAEKFAESLFE